MIKAKKLLISSFSMMTLLLAPVQSIFADEAVSPTSQEEVINTIIPTEEAVSTSSPSLESQLLLYDSVVQRGSVSYYISGYSTDIYLNGPVDVAIYPTSSGYYSISIFNSNGTLVESRDVGWLTSNNETLSHFWGLYGYHKVQVNGASGSFKVVWP